MTKEFNIRALRVSDWRSLRDVRLESLRFHPKNFGAHYADELRLHEPDWKEWIDSPKQQIFGLFHGSSLIGINGVVTCRDDSEGKTAKMVMWYMRAGYQGRGLFPDLVSAGIDWAKAKTQFERIHVAHRGGNHASGANIRKAGFTHISTEDWTWPDGITADYCLYEMRIER